MIARSRTLPEIRAEGFRALVERLGVSDALRFMQQYDLGQGDYTQERHEWLDSLSVDDIVRDIEEMRKSRPDADADAER
jgi:hypothetical protein